MCVNNWLRPSAIAAIVFLLGPAGVISIQNAAAAESLSIQIIADDMCCAGCAKKVAAQLYTAPGVTDVKANVAARSVVITAKPSRSLTMEKLWNAVEKGKGKPSKLVVAGVTYTLTRPDALGAEEQTPGVYRLVVADMQAHQSAEKVAKFVQAIRGVSNISLDAPHDALVVTPAVGASLSPWALAGAAQQAQEQPLSVAGPFGRLTIETPAAKNNISSRPGVEGEIR